MGESEAVLHGTKRSEQVKIIDKSKRAYEYSVESTRALELAVINDANKCSNCYTNIRSTAYSAWILMFKQHGRPPVDRLNFWFLGYAVTFSVELLLSFLILLHIANPSTNVTKFGLPYLFILPGLTIVAPLWGFASVLAGSADMMKTYSNMNSTLIVVNYPLTLLYLWFSTKNQAIYGVIICLLILNKVTLSFFGSKVRQHFANPCFAKNQMKMKETLADMIVIRSNTRAQSRAARASFLAS